MFYQATHAAALLCIKARSTELLEQLLTCKKLKLNESVQQWLCPHCELFPTALSVTDSEAAWVPLEDTEHGREWCYKWLGYAEFPLLAVATLCDDTTFVERLVREGAATSSVKLEDLPVRTLPSPRPPCRLVCVNPFP